jgi:hypothetical protein
MEHVPRHPEVDQEHTTTLEPNNQILAATIDSLDALALERGRHLGRIERTRQPLVGDLDADEATADEVRREPPPDRLDLRQLGHPRSLATSGPVKGRFKGHR